MVLFVTALENLFVQLLKDRPSLSAIRKFVIFMGRCVPLKKRLVKKSLKLSRPIVIHYLETQGQLEASLWCSIKRSSEQLSKKTQQENLITTSQKWIPFRPRNANILGFEYFEGIYGSTFATFSLISSCVAITENQVPKDFSSQIFTWLVEK